MHKAFDSLPKLMKSELSKIYKSNWNTIEYYLDRYPHNYEFIKDREFLGLLLSICVFKRYFIDYVMGGVRLTLSNKDIKGVVIGKTNFLRQELRDCLVFMKWSHVESSPPLTC